MMMASWRTAMRLKASLTVVCLAALAAPAMQVDDFRSEKARHEVADGKKEYRKGNYTGAVEHFKAAVALDDDWIDAKFALAGAFASEVVPGLYTPENQRLADQAIEAFLKILERDPQNSNALKDIALIYLDMKKLDQVREYSQKAVAAVPDDPDAYYLLGVADWAMAYEDTAKRKAKLGLTMDNEFKNTRDSLRLCAEIRADNQPRLDEGLAMLQKAMDKRQDYDDAMAYTSILYRRKADLECGNPQARIEDLRLSQKWIGESLAARKRQGANQRPSGSRYLEASDDGLETGNLEIMPLPPPPHVTGENAGQQR
jgi:tetratricopeptide (TPR) repeat protein